MGTINLGPYKPVGGTTSDATAIDTAFDTIQNVINGHIDDANVDPASLVATQQGKPLGLTGATAATRYVGATSSGAPVSGTFAVGDFVVAQNGKVWVCTVAGSPGTWVDPSATSGVTSYRKTTSKLANTTSETDLFNGEITVGAGVMGTSGMVRATCRGDLLFNNGNQTAPRFKVTLGGTTLLDSNVIATAVGASATRYSWRAVLEIMNDGAANAQTASIEMLFRAFVNTQTLATFTTGTGTYSSQNAHSPNSSIGEFFVNGITVGAVDTSAAKALAFTVTLPSATNTEWKLFDALVEVI